MFTIHDLDRDGNPYRELARTEFVDLAHTIALAITQRLCAEDSLTVMELLPNGASNLAIYNDGEPYSKVVLRERTTRHWQVEGETH